MIKEPIGFIGLGQLGAPMVVNLLADGYPVGVWNRTAEKARPLVHKGARQAECAEGAVEPGGILMTCLSNDQALESLWAEPPGAVLTAGPGRCSCVDEYDRAGDGATPSPAARRAGRDVCRRAGDGPAGCGCRAGAVTSIAAEVEAQAGLERELPTS
ncbi:MAG: hypothetical protein GX575_22205 [Candidatus Anammoximicrobium sp.]|nr:hypothetical protein [Candidatus Anammoximicrobium sp.]